MLQEKAHKCLIIELGGCLAYWKLLVNYHFTHLSDPEAVKKEFDETIVRNFRAGLKVKAILTDMGMRGVWRAYGINVGPHTNQNWVPHPCDPSDKLYILPDSTHVYKNIFSMMKNNRYVILHASTVQKFKLPGEKVDLEHLQQLATFQENSRWKLAPKLSRKLFDKNHFSQMAVLRESSIDGPLPLYVSWWRSSVLTRRSWLRPGLLNSSPTGFYTCPLETRCLL